MIERIVDIPFLENIPARDLVIDYIDGAVAFILFLVLFKIVQSVMLRYFGRLANRTATIVDNAFVEVVRSVQPPFYVFIAFYFAVRLMPVSQFIQHIVSGILFVWVVYQVIEALRIISSYLLQRKLRGEDNRGFKGAISNAEQAIKIVLWVFGGILILANFGVNVSSLIAGLGIGGVAIAFASQNIVADLFSSFAILLDKPFAVGDFIVVDKHSGVVKKIGIKTTRLRSLQGEEIVIANKELTSARIQNFRRMAERRIVFSLGVAPETSVAQLRSMPTLLEEALLDVAGIKFERVHLKSLDKNGAIFEVAYLVTGREYEAYLDAQHEINLVLKECLASRSIGLVSLTHTSFAPTETR